MFDVNVIISFSFMSVVSINLFITFYLFDQCSARSEFSQINLIMQRLNRLRGKRKVWGTESLTRFSGCNWKTLDKVFASDHHQVAPLARDGRGLSRIRRAGVWRSCLLFSPLYRGFCKVDVCKAQSKARKKRGILYLI